MIDCPSVSGTMIGLTIRVPLNSFLLQFCFTLETNKGSLKKLHNESNWTRECLPHFKHNDKKIKKEFLLRYVVKKLNCQKGV